LNQLRTMKVGGNQSATDFFNKKGGASLLRESDVKKKYTSEVAALYKEELARRVQEDATYFPDRIYVEGAEVASQAPAAAAEDDDFFSNWDKPAKPAPSSQPAKTTAAAPPSFGRTAALSPSLSSTGPSPSSTPTTSPPATAAPASRTVSSSSLTSNAKAPRASRLGATRTGSPANAGAGSSARPAKLGARKAAAPIDFDAAEKKAKEEAELKAKKLDDEKLAREKEMEEALKKAEEARKAAEEAKAKGIAASSVAAAKSPTSPTAANGKGSAATNQNMERLGMGMRKMAFGSVASNSASSGSGKKYPNYDNDTPTTARDKFGGQKAISSDMYFERKTYDPTTVSEAQARLQNFQGATSISSSAYFGRDEEEELEAANGARGAGGGGDGLANLEASARDMAQRFLSNPDVQNAADNIRAGALKLSEYLAQFGDR